MKRAAALVVGCVLAAGPAPAQDAAPGSQAPAPSFEERTAQVLDTCFQCHGPGGVSVIPSRPTIAGQNASYVARQLMAFRRAARQDAGDVDADADDGPRAMTGATRSDPVMEHMAENLSPGMIQAVARAVSQLPCAPKQGDTRPVPPKPPVAERCDVCHGADGIAAQPEIPNLAGQRRAYLRRQLLLIRETAYGAEPREGERWRSHPIMEREAGRISISDVDALARYYAALDCRGAGTGAGADAAKR